MFNVVSLQVILKDETTSRDICQDTTFLGPILSFSIGVVEKKILAWCCTEVAWISSIVFSERVQIAWRSAFLGLHIIFRVCSYLQINLFPRILNMATQDDKMRLALDELMKAQPRILTAINELRQQEYFTEATNLATVLVSLKTKTIEAVVAVNLP